MSYESKSPLFLRCRINKARLAHDDREIIKDGVVSESERPISGEYCDECVRSVPANGFESGMHGSECKHGS